MKKFFVFVAVLLFFVFPSSVLAIYDPLSVPNNHFGIHISSENDLKDAATLVNTNGDWGYITFVITEGERDHGRWQTAMDTARRLHLIPIVRIATKADNDTWEAPNEAEINNWVAFLNSLNWVIQNRYVIIGNEPNHTNEWGGKVDPAGYAEYLISFSKALKGANDDFFVLPAGLDAAANNSRTTITEKKFISGMLKENPDVFNYVDGWVSHSYPTTGIDTYKSELSYLKSLGVTKDLPVFITETGWQLNSKLTNEGVISKDYESAFSGIWSDKNIVAVTPFILDYPEPPFDKFSWKKKDGSFYSFYNTITDMQKVTGEPIQDTSGSILAILLPSFDLTNSEVSGAILAKNTGESIWDNTNLDLIASGNGFQILKKSLDTIEPGKVGLIYLKGLTPGMGGTYKLFIGLTYKGRIISNIYSSNQTNIDVPQVQNEGFFAKIRSYLNKVTMSLGL